MLTNQYLLYICNMEDMKQENMLFNEKPLGALLSKALYSLNSLHRTRMNQANIDLPHSQFLVLRYLYDTDRLSQIELAKLLGKDVAAIKRTVDNLEAKGWVRREQADRRKNRICITEKGLSVMPEIRKITCETIDMIINGIPESTYATAVSFLNQISENSEKEIKRLSNSNEAH